MNILKIKNRKEVLSWCLYDFANQPFTTIIVTFLYGAFFVDTIAENNKIGTTLWTFAISSTAIIVSLLSPILGAIADNGGYRKYFLIFLHILQFFLHYFYTFLRKVMFFWHFYFL